MAQYRPGEAILMPHGDTQPCLWVVHSGHVQQEEQGHVHVLGAGESFNWRAVLTGHNEASVTALDDVRLWQLPKETLLQLLAGNARFSAKVFSEVAGQLADNEEMDQHRELLSLMLVRVRDAYLQKPFYVDGQLDLVSVCRLLSEHKTGNALVRDVQDGLERIGMFTTTDLRDALLQPSPPAQLAVRDVARFDLVTVAPDAELFDALLIMLRHRVHRVLVKDGDSHRGGAEPARPDEFHVEPLAPDHAAGRAGAQRDRAASGSAAGGRHHQAAAARRHARRDHLAAGE